MATKIINSLINKIKTTGSLHKKKLIVIAVFAIAFIIAKKRLKTNHIINTVMFFFKISSKVMDLFPAPIFTSYRSVLPFTYQPQQSMPELIKAMNISEILPKIKKNVHGAIEELKLCVLSGVVSNIIMYNATSLYELIKNKYYSDFQAFGAAQMFEETIINLKEKFSNNLLNLNSIITSQLHDKISKIDLDQVVDLKRIRQIFEGLVDQIFVQIQDISDKFWKRKTSASHTKQYKTAEHYFKSTKQLVAGQTIQKRGKIGKAFFSLIYFPFKMLGKIMEKPEEQLTPLRYQSNQFLYVLCLKQFKVLDDWPNMESKYLFQMVMEELTSWFYSINFSIIMKKNSEFNLCLFINRVDLYFSKNKKKSAPLKALISVFYKICEEEIVKKTNQQRFYERQLYSAFKDTKIENRKMAELESYSRRNNILLEIYFKNQLEHLDRDMQAKFFNERDGIMINPVAKNVRASEEKDDIQQLLEAFQMTKQSDGKQNNMREQVQTNNEALSGQRMIREYHQ